MVETVKAVPGGASTLESTEKICSMGVKGIVLAITFHEDGEGMEVDLCTHVQPKEAVFILKQALANMPRLQEVQ